MSNATFRITGTDDLLSLAAELAREAEIAPEEARKVVQRGAVNIKKDWRERWKGYPHAPRLPYAIGYDTHARGSLAAAEIGPDKDKPQGALGNLFEFGSVNNRPIPGGAPALEAERPKFEAAMEALGFAGPPWR